jgi:hypothetical protein
MLKDIRRYSLVCSFAMFQTRSGPVCFLRVWSHKGIPQGFLTKSFTTKSFQGGENDGLYGLLSLEIFRAVCMSVGPLVRQSVRRSVRPSIGPLVHR